MSRSQQASGIDEVGPFTGSRSAGKDTKAMLDLGKSFEKFWRSKQLRSTGKLYCRFQFAWLLNIRGLENISSKRRQILSNPVSIQENPPSYKDVESMQFERHLTDLSSMVLQYENPDLLDDAMRSLPLEDIYHHAEGKFQLKTAEGRSIGDERPGCWGYQDYVIRELLRYSSNLDSAFLGCGLHLPC